MFISYALAAPRETAYETNNVDAGVVKFWSQDVLRIIEDNLVFGGLVDRSFSPTLANEGDTVNIQRPNTYRALRIDAADDVTVQDSTLSNVAVKLDQGAHVSFRMRDVDLSLNRHDLIRLFLRPAGVALAEQIERVLAAQVYQFRQNRVPGSNNVVGDLGGLTVNNAKQQVIQVRKQFNDNRAPQDNRWVVLDTATDASLLELDLFNAADKVGDRGQALRDGFLGTKMGLNFVWGNGVMSPTTATLGALNADELAASANPGDTVISVDLGTNYAVGEYITLEGDLQPYRITAISTNDLTISPPIRRFVDVNVSDIQTIATGTVDLAGDPNATAYPAGWTKQIKVDGTGVPVVGQLVSFNTAGTPNVALAGEYGIVDVDSTSGIFITLDRPLETTIADGDVVGYGPAGSYNFAFWPGAFTLVIRGIATPPDGLGAISTVADFDGLAMRTTLSYEGLKRSILVTMDILMGVKVLEENYGVPFLA